MKDFLTDEEMAQLENPAAPSPAAQAAPAGDFLTDEQMAAMSPDHPDEAAATVSDAQMNQMENPDHAAVNEMIRAAISKGMTKEQIIALAEANGVPDAQALPLDGALEWRKHHKDYTGHVEAFGEHPDVRTQPKNEVSTPDAIGAGIGQGLTFGFGDEIGAGIGAASNAVASIAGGGTGEDFGDYYARVRDENRDYLHDAEDQHSIAYGGGQIAGSIPAAFIGGAPATGARLLARAGAEGALYGAGQSEARSIDGLAADTALGGVVGAGSAGLLNRAGAAISPTVSPMVRKLMGAGIELTPTQVLKAGGAISRAIGGTVEKIGRRGVVTSEAMRSAEGRAFASRDAIQAQQDAAVAAARAAGLNATPRHPDLLTDADKILGKRHKDITQAEMLANVLLGYGSTGASLAADVGVASFYTKPGTALANGLITGRQGPVPRAIRGYASKLSPLAGNASAINTQHTEN